MKALELKIPPVALTLIFALSMWLVATYIPSLGIVMPWHIAIAATFVAVGFAIGLAAVVAFYRAGTTVNPFKPTTASTMITSGIYRVSRNPMYLGLLFMLTGWAVVLSDLIAFALLPAFVAYMTRFQIWPEERALFSKFGPAFAAYRALVRRWL